MANYSDQIDRLPFNALNGGTGDPIQGQPIASASGLPVIGYDGQLMKRYVAGGTGPGPEATRLSNTTIGTLYGGVYQYVLFYASSSAAAAVLGQALFWQDPTKGIVTPDGSATSVFSGIALNAVVKGDYNWQQIGGLATGLIKSGITKTTPAIGDLVVIDGSTNKLDILADATSITWATGRLMVGRAWGTAPASAAASQIILWPFGANSCF